MSAALAAIAEKSRGLVEALGAIPVVSDEIIDSFKLAEEKIIKFYDTTGGAFQLVNENTIEMLESFEKTNEKMVAMIEKVEDKSKITENFAKSIERVGKSSGGIAKGFQDMTDGALKIAQSFGLISPHVAQGVSGVVQLGRGIAALRDILWIGLQRLTTMIYLPLMGSAFS